jgi:tRNA threonylcarbamoyladenosine biosynthesis protein TsaB
MIWAEEIWYAAREQTRQVLPRIQRMLAVADQRVADLEGIVVSIGPGSYTGVRIGVAIAKGLALPHNLSVMGVPTLDVTAYPHRHQPLPVLAVAQAGRKRFLAAQYGWVDEIWTQTMPPEVTTLAQLADCLAAPTLVTGEVTAADAAFLEKESKSQVEVAAVFERVRRPGVLAALGAMKLAAHAPDELDGLVPIYAKSP